MKRHLVSLALVLLAASPAAAAQPVSIVPQAVGDRVFYRVVRTTQGTSGPLTTTVTFDLVRRTGTTLVIERGQPGSPPNISVLTVKKDGTIALAEDPSAAASDADVADLLNGLNFAIAAVRGADAATRTPWVVTVPVAPNSTTNTSFTIVPANATATGFDFGGDGIASAAPAAGQPGGESGGGARRGGGGFPGGGGGGFPGGGGGYPRRSRGGDSGGPGGFGGPAMIVSMHVDGHVSGGRVDRITIDQTRSITVGNLPFVNVSSWQISVVK